MLNISPGSYLSNDAALKPPPFPEPSEGFKEDPLPREDVWPLSLGHDIGDHQKQTEDLFSKDMDNSLDLVKKVSSELSDILLDKSSLDTVDELLNERLNDLMPLDVPSLADTQALSRSIFSTNSLELHNVSGSTEDLLKSLENLSPEISSASVSLPPPDFDFTVLSTDFVTDR